MMTKRLHTRAGSLTVDRLKSGCEIEWSQKSTEGSPMKKGRTQPADFDVGRRVRLRRLEIGMSQQKLGEHLGVSFQQVQNYEKGTNRISASRLQQIAELLDAPVSYFFEGVPIDKQSGGNEGHARLMSFLSSRQGVALARSFLRVKSGKVRREMVELVESIAAAGGRAK
jgi:transcriptional regulator with XRE-family HTH domain